MYELIFDEKPIDFLEKLEYKIKERIFRKIISSKENPLRYFEKLSNRDEYKLRVGNYRIIAYIDEYSNKIRILFIGHRKNIYRRF